MQLHCIKSSTWPISDLQGTLVSLIHPAIMDFLFLVTVWQAYTGWQWRRTRTIPEELKTLRQSLPPKDEEGNRPVTKTDGRIAALEEVGLHSQK